jgi:ABC-2 type transport system permease protein
LDFAGAQDRIEESDTLAVVTIPSGYQDAVAQAKPIEIGYYADPDLSAPVFIEQALQSALQEVNGAIQAAEFSARIANQLPGLPEDPAFQEVLRQDVSARAATLWESNPVKVEYESTAEAEEESGSAPAGFYQSVPGIATMFAMSTVLGGMVGLIGERKRWTFQRLIMMPLRPSSILGGKLSGRFTLGIVQFLVVFAVGFLVGMRLGDSLLGLLMIMASFTLAMTAISYALGTYVFTEPQAESLTQLLVLTLAPLGGAWWPLEITPRALQVIGHLSPVAWAMDGFQDLILRGSGASAVLPETLVLLGFAIVFGILGARRFRYA